MQNHDTKFKNAKEKMINGLIKILQYKEFLDITVKELCLVSNINRTTFYAHYNNTYELLDDSQTYMIEKFLSSFPNGPTTADEQTKVDFISKKYLVPYLNFIKENKIIYETYQKNSVNITKNDNFQKIIKDVARPIYRRTSTDDIALIYISRFYIDGISSVVNEWISRNFKESVDYIAELIVHIKEHSEALK